MNDYTHHDGVFILDVEGGLILPDEKRALLQKVDEFRNTNRGLKAQVDELLPLKAKVDALGDPAARIGDPSDLDAVIKQSIDKAMEPVKLQLEQERKTRETAEQRATDEAFKWQIAETARKFGARDGSLNYLIGRAKENFDYRDGHIVAKPGQYSEDNVSEPLTLKEFFTRLAIDEAPHFQPTGGTGANHGRPGAGGARVLRSPSTEQFSANIDKIARGEVEVVD